MIWMRNRKWKWHRNKKCKQPFKWERDIEIEMRRETGKI